MQYASLGTHWSHVEGVCRCLQQLVQDSLKSSEFCLCLYFCVIDSLSHSHSLSLPSMCVCMCVCSFIHQHACFCVPCLSHPSSLCVRVFVMHDLFKNCKLPLVAIGSRNPTGNLFSMGDDGSSTLSQNIFPLCL